MKRLLFKFSVFVILLFCLVVFYLFHISYKDYSNYFQNRHGALAKAIEQGDSVKGRYWITLLNADGFKVECGLLIPTDAKKKYPAIILLGGKATGKYAIDYAIDIDNVIILALDYPYEPREKYSFWTIVWDVSAVRKVLIDMVPSSMLAIDFLFQHENVDTTKIIILGYSFGAPFVPVVSALDKRVSVAVMVYGGGDLRSLIRHNVARYEGAMLSEFVGTLGGLLLHPIEPMNYAGKISPTPLVMINGLNDEQIPKNNTEKFFNSAKEPKKLIWLESKHVNPNNPDLTRKIISTLKDELKRLSIK